MRPSVHVQNWGPSFSKHDLHLIDKVADMGFEGIEIPLVTSVVNDLPIQEAKRRLADRNLRASFDTGLDADQNLASTNAQFRQNGTDHLKRCMDIIAEFGGDELGGVCYGAWGYFSGSAPTQTELQRSADCLRLVAEYAAPLGIDLAIEPVSRFEGYLIPTAADGLAYLDLVGMKNVGLHLDTFQMNIEEQDLPAAIRSAAGRLYHFHLCASHRGVPGRDHVDWPGVFDALRVIGYTRWLTIEAISSTAGEAAAAAKAWRQIAPPDDIALGGLDLIRRHLGTASPAAHSPG
ncbi:MAG: sugar phosphate isomerase/epimerase [Phycisphaeraceae bacterium]|nr:sugar phosphate isomerase/epimerase [Phycisphaeraceae bacterium]